MCFPRSVIDQGLDVVRHCGAEASALAELSLSLGGLEAELMTAIGVVELYFSTFGERESLCGCLMVLDFDLCHFR